MRFYRFLASTLLALLLLIGSPSSAWAFCGFYVAQADTKLYNQASQVVIARDGDRTILTMANDYQGDVKDFAIVVPVPVAIKKEQVRIGDPKIIERLDAFSAPRLVEYFDENPCQDFDRRERNSLAAGAVIDGEKTDALGVTVEAKFNVGEYEILVLSAKESDGLESWLKQNNYKLPKGASSLLKPYIKQQMKFFVAKVNLKEFKNSNAEFLRPLAIAYQSPKFMLPIRLGMLNAEREQDLIAYILSPKGQVEVTNYRTVKVPSDTEIPLYVKDQFGKFYTSMFQTAYVKEDRKVAFLEYAWNMSNCDPCAAEPLNNEELQKAGVFWLQPDGSDGVFITRLHLRYSRDKFPEDLTFQETSNQEQFQGRYILRHGYKRPIRCGVTNEYKKRLRMREEQQAQNLARLTGWNIKDIRREMGVSETVESTEPFWRNIWGQ